MKYFSAFCKFFIANLEKFFIKFYFRCESNLCSALVRIIEKFFLCIVLVFCINAHADTSPVGLGLPPAPSTSFAPSTWLSVALGQKIFFDQRLSGDGKISCATCHQPEFAFTDRRPLAKGIGAGIGTRNTPSLLNAIFNTSQFWDGRRETLEAQALDPFVNPREHGLAHTDRLLNLLRNDPGYRSAFQTAFNLRPNEIRVGHVRLALASFERTLVAGNSPFDQYYYNKRQANLTSSAVRGLSLFQGAAKCSSCHVINEKHALFSDNQFHSLNVGLQSIASRLPTITTQLVRLRAEGKNLDQTVLSDQEIAELGRFSVTLDPIDIGKFRTPSLRNVALTAPYMHDGSIATLEQAVELEIYYRSAEAGIPLILTPQEKRDLVEFLKALTSPTATTFLMQSKDSPPRR